ncbi:MAG TPA: TolC family outer membrane protein [Ideonella sp.]|nr:TolC family outer membrane protein [Ideonella sp.]
MPNRLSCLGAAALLALAASAGAQTADPLGQAAQKALLANPEVTARFNAFRAAADAVDAARGGLYPRVDLQASAGHVNDDFRNSGSDSFGTSGVALSATQLLWDGLTTQSEVGRLGHEKLARYFEFVDASEQTALEVARAWYDVLRYRQLVTLAEDNYVQHKTLAGQIQSRVKAGVGRGVDLEQAAARVALAESNLNAESSNLHDVTARYQRLVGEPPPAQMAMGRPLTGNLPASANAAVGAATQRNAAISASIESLRAAREAAKGRQGAFQPTVQARVRAGTGHNFDATLFQRNNTSAEVVLNWNLFNGGSDTARVRQAANLINQAADVRDKTCRDTRQTAEIAFNDTKKLAEQVEILDRNVLAIDKARDAYRQQFDIGQRSLLDLLNAENESYTAKRAYQNAVYDLATAQARTQAALQQLAPQLGLTHIDAGKEGSDVTGWSGGDDAPGRCPAAAVETPTTPKNDLDARAQKLAANAPTPAPAKR